MGGELEPIESLWIQLGGDDTLYAKMTKSVIEQTESMANKVKDETTKMVDHVVEENKRAAKSYGTGPLSIGDIFPELGEMKGKLEELATAEKELGDVGEVAKHFGELSEKLKGAAEGAEKLAPWLKQIHPALGTGAEAFGEYAVHGSSAVGMLAKLGPFAAEGAAVLATFAATVTGVTYAISGWEGVQNMIPNMLEGSKIVLAANTFGLLDYTAATAEATRHDKAFADQQTANTALIVETMSARKAVYTDLDAKVNELKDHSMEAEEKYIESLKLGSREGGGHTGPQIESISQDIAAKFQTARVEDYIKALRDEADVYKKTKEELADLELTRNHATDAQRAEIAAIREKMKAIDEGIAAEKKAKEEAKEAERVAKRMAEEAKREHDKLVKEGEALHKSFETPLEKLQNEAKRAFELFRMGVISADDLYRSMEKLDKGPKESIHNMKLASQKDIGIEANEFGSSEELAVREAYRQNLAGSKPKRDVAAADRAVRDRGLLPAGGVGGVALTKEEIETRRLLNEMVTALRLIVSGTDPKKVLRVSVAGLSK